MRITFIDLAKGLCILLVIMVHTGVPSILPGMYGVKVPIFFTIAGLFFLKSVNRGGYLLSKVNSLFIPFCIYYLCSYALFYIIYKFKPEFLIGQDQFSILDVFKQRQLFNGPLWFLLCLFEVECLFYFLFKITKNYVSLGVTSLGIGISGLILSAKNVFLPCWFDTTLVAIPFFYVGYLISKTKYLEKEIKAWKLIGTAVLLYLIFLICPISIGMSVNEYSNIYLVFPFGIILVLIYLLISKAIGNMQAISWLGRNTLVILCTHHIAYRPVKFILIKANIDNSIFLFLITVLIEVLVVFAINNFLPVLTGKYKFIKR